MRRFKVCRRRILRISIGSILDLGGSLEECPFLLLLFLDLLVFLVFLLGELVVYPCGSWTFSLSTRLCPWSLM